MEKGFVATVAITNMSSEMFNDALFYRELGDCEKNIFPKWRFYRSSIIFFCISVEAWVNKLLAHNLGQKTQLSDDEKKLYRVLTEEIDFIPPGIKLTNYNKFNKLLAEQYKFEIIKGSVANNALEKYLDFVDYRNKIIHFTDRNYKKVYNTNELKKYTNSAPDIIQALFDELYSISPELVKVGYPNWFKDRRPKDNNYHLEEY